MDTYMNDKKLKTLAQLSQFLEGTALVTFTPPPGLNARYQWIGKVLKQFNYHRLRKRDKSKVCAYIEKVMGYSHQQLSRLITQHREYGQIGKSKQRRHCFFKRYSRADVMLLV